MSVRLSVCPFLRKQVSQFLSFPDETFPSVFFPLQVVYKSERAGSDHYLLYTKIITPDFFDIFISNIGKNISEFRLNLKTNIRMTLP